MKDQKGHKIKEILPGSIAEEMEVEAGDCLLAVNGQEVEDVFDYRFLINEEELEVTILKENGEEWVLEIEKEYEEDLGIVFEKDLMSEYHSCCNRCMFCFIDQMPKGMRETLYFKDDDSRLSFLQGNYITLTNMKDKDIDRIIKFHLAPINISVHTTNPELRCRMLNNRFAGKVLSYLPKLYENQIEMNGQIVLCKGVNDGEELERTISDLSAYLPFMRSVSVVPAGITRYREGLPEILLHEKEDAGKVIDLVEKKQKEFYEQYGLHFIHASDEFYLLAERELPEEERYDGYIQLENGVGMMRLLETEFLSALEERKQRASYQKEKEKQRRIMIATGKLAWPLLSRLAKKAMEEYPVQITVLCIENHYFGETITVAGLITGQDLISQVQEAVKKGTEPGDCLIISSNMLRMGEEVFLDDITVNMAQQQLGMKVCPVGAGGEDLLRAILEEDYKMEPRCEGEVYIQSYSNL